MEGEGKDMTSEELHSIQECWHLSLRVSCSPSHCLQCKCMCMRTTLNSKFQEEEAGVGRTEGSFYQNFR